jgi:hypothetical protein
MANDLLPIDIPPGVVRGATPLDAKGRWWDTNLVRWSNGVLEPIGGWEKRIATPFTSRIRKLKTWRDNAQRRFTLAASAGKINVDFTGGSFADVTPAGFDAHEPSLDLFGYGTNDFGEETFGDARSTASQNLLLMPPYWTFAGWGEDMLGVLSGDGRLYSYDVTNPATPFAVVAGAPVNNGAVHVTPERHVMLLQLGGNARRIGWCSRENYSDWNFSSTTNTAGYLDLDTETPLLTAAQSRAGTLVFSSSDVSIMTYRGLPYIYGKDWVGQTRLVNPDTVVSDNGNVFWWAADGFKVFDGGSIRSIPCPVWDFIVGHSTINSRRLFAHGSALGSRPEIWWFYPSDGGFTCDRYIIFNYEEGWWAIGSLPRSAMVGAGSENYPLMVGENGMLYQHESGWSGAAPGDRQVWAETSALTLGGGARTMDIKQALIANGASYDALNLSFYTNLAPEGAGRVFGPYQPRADGYTDARVSGRDIRVRFEGTKNIDWSVGELRLDWSIGSGR